MKIEILEFVEGARKAQGLAVVIDVFRAFSVGCYLFDAGVKKIIATGDPEKAYSLKHRYRNSFLIGEKDEKRIKGFDFGNSPAEIIKSDLSGKIAIHTTTAGTNGLINTINSDIVITGSLVNAKAIIDYVKYINPEYVSLVAMGYRATETANEDLLCARIIESGLKSRYSIPKKEISDLKNSSGKRFFNPDNLDFSPPSDFYLCTMVDRFDFVIKAVNRYEDSVELIRVD